MPEVREEEKKTREKAIVSGWHVVGEVVFVLDVLFESVRQLVEVVFADTADETWRLQQTHNQRRVLLHETTAALIQIEFGLAA